MTDRVEQIKQIISELTPEQQKEVLRFVKSITPKHPFEERLNIEAETVLSAINRADELILRNIRGVIAEAAFGVYVLNRPSNAYVLLDASGRENSFSDYVIGDKIGGIRVQVKLQRSEKQQPKVLPNGYYAVEVQRTRTGLREIKSKDEEGKETVISEETRPYRHGQFDILAVNLYPSTGNWSNFMYTLSRWLVVNPKDKSKIKVMQPIPKEANNDWTDDFETCVTWFRGEVEKSIADPKKERRTAAKKKLGLDTTQGELEL